MNGEHERNELPSMVLAKYQKFGVCVITVTD